jgi:hypothetical protein
MCEELVTRDIDTGNAEGTKRFTPLGKKHRVTKSCTQRGVSKTRRTARVPASRPCIKEDQSRSSRARP